jgi:hypothetical protein
MAKNERFGWGSDMATDLFVMGDKMKKLYSFTIVLSVLIFV